MELCIAEHYPTQVHLKDGEWLEEPPAVEGFVYTVDAKTQRRTQLFLSTHDNYLFRVPFNRAVSPSSPSDLKNYSKNENDLRKEEASRLRSQVINSKAFWDLRHVLVVPKSSSESVSSPASSHSPPSGSIITPDAWSKLSLWCSGVRARPVGLCASCHGLSSVADVRSSAGWRAGSPRML